MLPYYLESSCNRRVPNRAESVATMWPAAPLSLRMPPPQQPPTSSASPARRKVVRNLTLRNARRATVDRRGVWCDGRRCASASLNDGATFDMSPAASSSSATAVDATANAVDADEILQLETLVLIDTEVSVDPEACNGRALRLTCIRSTCSFDAGYAPQDLAAGLSESSVLTAPRCHVRRLRIEFMGTGCLVSEMTVDELLSFEAFSSSGINAIRGVRLTSERARIDASERSRRLVALDVIGPAILSPLPTPLPAPQSLFPYRLGCGITVPPPPTTGTGFRRFFLSYRSPYAVSFFDVWA